MPGLTLRYPIHALDSQLLFPPGTFLTQETLDAFIDSHEARPNQTYSLLSYGSVKEDCLYYLRTPPYLRLFSEDQMISDLLTLLETVSLPIPVLQALDYFKRHDLYTYAHILMVFALSTLLAKDLIPDDQECIRLSATGPTHDLGKICVPLPILRKTTPLTRAEHDYLEHHATAGYVLLGCYYKDIRHLACKVALDHHERRDGSGYPRSIPLKDPVVEVIVVSDVYDALVKPRPYRSESYDTRTALEEIIQMAEHNKIGWDVAKALIGHHRTYKSHYSEIILSVEKRGVPPPNNVYGILAEGERADPKD